MQYKWVWCLQIEFLNLLEEVDYQEESDQKIQDAVLNNFDVAFHDVRFSYGQGEEVLKGISFHLTEGKNHCNSR